MLFLIPALISVLGAIVLAGVGGELFLWGVLGAAALRVPKLLVATSLAAFATSSPELTVSTLAALAGQPEIGLGDALGSNVVNIASLFGLALLFGPIRVECKELGRDFVLALAIPILSLWFVSDGPISRSAGALLLLIFAFWMGLLIQSGLATCAPASVAEAAGSTAAEYFNPRPWMPPALDAFSLWDFCCGNRGYRSHRLTFF